MKKGFFPGILLLILAAASMASCGTADKQSRSDGGAQAETSTSSKIIAHMNNFTDEEESSVSADPVNTKPTEIEKCTVTVRDRVYCEKYTEPYISVKYGNNTLVRGKDYTVVYDETTDKGAGRYSLTVRMCGDYQGSKKYDYYIKPVGTSIHQTGSKVGSITVGWLKRNSADGYEIEYSNNQDMSDAKITEISGGDNDSFCFDALDENTTLYVRIRSFKILDDGKKLCSPYSDIISADTKKIEVRDGVTYIDGIVIANKTYALPEYYGDGLDSEALEAFSIMCSDASQEGLWLEIISGFRSYYTQAVVYESFCSDRGKEAADRVSARPGHSEHQTGLAMDINSTWFTFADTAEGKWLAENCWKYGFIIRYPEGKEDITGYAYESWHIRYVGMELAKTLHESGETLEEYFGITSYYDE